uniref:CD24 molecule n=1 Tax=Rattus norvegicus TaxID=10116 RepID=A0A8L2PZU1_RAT
MRPEPGRPGRDSEKQTVAFHSLRFAQGCPSGFAPEKLGAPDFRTLEIQAPGSPGRAAQELGARFVFPISGRIYCNQTSVAPFSGNQSISAAPNPTNATTRSGCSSLQSTAGLLALSLSLLHLYC